MSFLHLNDSEHQPSRDSPAYDKLYKARPLLDIIITNFQQAYTPNKHISIDESIISFKGFS